MRKKEDKVPAYITIGHALTLPFIDSQDCYKQCRQHAEKQLDNAKCKISGENVRMHWLCIVLPGFIFSRFYILNNSVALALLIVLRLMIILSGIQLLLFLFLPPWSVSEKCVKCGASPKNV